MGNLEDNWKTALPETEVVVMECEGCGDEIYEGDTAYNLEDEVLCEDCFIEKAKAKFSFTVEASTNPNDEWEGDFDD